MELRLKVGDSGAGFVKGFFGDGINLGTDLFDFFFGDDARVEEFAREQATDWGVGIDFGVEGWLSEAGFVPFVVAVAAVADEIEDNILMKALAEFEGQLNDGSGGERRGGRRCAQTRARARAGARSRRDGSGGGGGSAPCNAPLRTRPPPL